MFLLLYFFAAFGVCSNAQFVMDGPDAPMVIPSLIPPNGFKLTLDNPPNSNNYNNWYQELDFNNNNFANNIVRFQGYHVYQVNDTISDFFEIINNTTKSRLAAQMDLQDSIYSGMAIGSSLSCNYFQAMDSVNAGVTNYFDLYTDQFTNGPFVPGNRYYFYVVSFAYNSEMISASCGNLPVQLLFSKKSPEGSILLQRLDLNTVGISANEKESFQVYPNPAKDKIQITTNSNINRIELFDIYGKLVFQEEGGPAVQKTYSLSTSGLSRGIYLLRINESFQKIVLD
ncbi:MAG: T9SS type A sorting domain-containing protein [Flavobacteriales bacterium]|nr:T9SS type A sorting domain-containing protein [Flavobacteriales bacterium]